MPFGGTWTYELEPWSADGRTGTRLTITERGRVKPPVFRFLSKHVFGHERTAVGLLEQLAAHLGERATIEAV